MDRGLALPTHQGLTDEALDQIATGLECALEAT
jgi:hypothetical protein